MKSLAIHAEFDDGSVYDTTSRTSDYVSYEIEAKKRGWGSLSENPSTWEAWIAYKALLRNKLISMPWDMFLSQAALVEATPIAEVEGLPTTATAD